MTMLDVVRQTDRYVSMIGLSYDMRPDCRCIINRNQVHVSSFMLSTPRLSISSILSVIPHVFIGFIAFRWCGLLTTQVYDCIKRIDGVVP